MILILFLIASCAGLGHCGSVVFDDNYVLHIENKDGIDDDRELEIKIKNDYCNVFAIDGKLYADTFKNTTKQRTFKIKSIGSTEISYKFRNTSSSYEGIFVWSFILFLLIVALLDSFIIVRR